MVNRREGPVFSAAGLVCELVVRQKLKNGQPFTGNGAQLMLGAAFGLQFDCGRFARVAHLGEDLLRRVERAGWGQFADHDFGLPLVLPYQLEFGERAHAKLGTSWTPNSRAVLVSVLQEMGYLADGAIASLLEVASKDFLAIQEWRFRRLQGLPSPLPDLSSPRLHRLLTDVARAS